MRGCPAQYLHVVEAAVVLAFNAKALFRSPTILFALDPVGVRLVHHTAGVAKPI